MLDAAGLTSAFGAGAAMLVAEAEPPIAMAAVAVIPIAAAIPARLNSCVMRVPLGRSAGLGSIGDVPASAWDSVSRSQQEPDRPNSPFPEAVSMAGIRNL